LTAFIAGRTDLSVWDFGDGYVQVNEPYTSHAWTAPGAYLVALWAYNDSYPGGVSATVTVHVEAGVHYVAATSGNPVAPYTSWATAATNIQDAVDVAAPGATIFVTNGTYASGSRVVYSTSYNGTMTNRVAVDKPLAMQSVNGPQVTVIDCGYAVGCVYLTNGATLFGFTLTNGYADSGGGVYCESTSAVLSNCVLTGNSAYEGWGGPRRRSLWRHAQQLHADRQLGIRRRRRGIFLHAE
jgi:PKD repeat protein